MTDDFADAIRVYHEASWPVLNDRVVWLEESERHDAPHVPWPGPLPRTQYQRLLRLLFLGDVDVVLALLKCRDDPLSPSWPPDPRDPKFQTVLRVVVRSMSAGDAALVAAYGGERVTGKREFQNRAIEHWTELALRYARTYGLTRDQAFELFDIPRRRGFRAAKRVTKRKK